MAWRIDDAVIRGELDNTTRGRVRGRIWFVGLAEPVVLDLAGDCHRDLAGRRLEFTNPSPKPGDLDRFAPVQRGTTGDISASRKVRVPDIPLEQIGEYYAAKKPFPWHWGNALYLEWYGERNGRVVIESASYDLRIVGEPAWEMTPAEEDKQRAANAGAMDGFMQQLGEAADARTKAEAESAAADAEGKAADADEDDETAEWNSKPFTEEEAERMQERSDLLSDRITARVEREGIEHYEKILEEEIARLRRERGEPEPTPEQLARNAEWMAELEQAAAELEAETDEEEDDDESGPGIEADETVSADDPDEDDDPFGDKHPLAERAYRLSLRLMREPEEFGWATEDMAEEHPVAELIGASMKAGVKLAGALDGEDWPPDINFAASIVVRLKRARGYLDDALRAAADCREQKLTDLAWLAAVERELTEIAEAADALIAELRALLDRGVE